MNTGERCDLADAGHDLSTGAEDASRRVATAHQEWDQRWRDPEHRAEWLEPEVLVRATVPLLRQRDITSVLDVGCGIGRHARFLAAEGFTCAGIDGSAAGIDFARQQAAACGLAIDYRIGEFYALPFDDHSFGLVIAWNVLYHGDGATAQRALREICRVLKPGGLYVGTMLSKRNARYGQGREVSRDTFVIDGGEEDKAHPHFYCDAATLVAMHQGLEVIELRDHEQIPGAYHWQFVMERHND